MNQMLTRDANRPANALPQTARYESRRFVIFPLGGECYALDSCQVKELVMGARVHGFPNTTGALEGVLVRRGAAVPVCGLDGAFGNGGARRLYVIAQCRYEGGAYLVAFPVNGACEVVEGEAEGATPVEGREVTFVAGLLRTSGRTVPLLDLDRVVAHCMQGPKPPARAVVAGEAER